MKTMSLYNSDTLNNIPYPVLTCRSCVGCLSAVLFLQQLQEYPWLGLAAFTAAVQYNTIQSCVSMPTGITYDMVVVPAITHHGTTSLTSEYYEHSLTHQPHSPTPRASCPLSCRLKNRDSA